MDRLRGTALLEGRTGHGGRWQQGAGQPGGAGAGVATVGAQSVGPGAAGQVVQGCPGLDAAEAT